MRLLGRALERRSLRSVGLLTLHMPILIFSSWHSRARDVTIDASRCMPYALLDRPGAELGICCGAMPFHGQLFSHVCSAWSNRSAYMDRRNNCAGESASAALLNACGTTASGNHPVDAFARCQEVRTRRCNTQREHTSYSTSIYHQSDLSTHPNRRENRIQESFAQKLTSAHPAA